MPCSPWEKIVEWKPLEHVGIGCFEKLSSFEGKNVLPLYTRVLVHRKVSFILYQRVSLYVCKKKPVASHVQLVSIVCILYLEKYKFTGICKNPDGYYIICLQVIH